MPISIAKAQQAAINDGFLDSSAIDAVGDNGPIRLGITAKVLAQYGAEFKLNVAKLANERGVVASGALFDDNNFRVVLSEDGNSMQIIMNSYFDYPNQGVKGVNSSKNAPNSPYQYKNYGMSEDGRRSISTYISSGKAKIETVVKTRDKALGVGSERKGLNLLETQTETLIYLIKAYGIKATHYFTDAVKETFKDFELVMSEAVGQDVVFTLNKKNKK